jgi:metacaspase-1
MASIAEQAEKMIAAEFHMISGCRDEQTSADVSNVASFQLPDPAGAAGGACTSAMLKVLYNDHKTPETALSFQEVLLQMRGILKESRFDQVPQLSSSRSMDIKKPFTVVPDNFSGTRRAVVIAINYVGQQGELRGCQNDANNMIEYIKDVHGFQDENIAILMDDGKHTSPTYDNILAAYKKLVSECKAGDAVFLHYSGHGGKLRDEDGDEKDGYDETLVPVSLFCSHHAKCQWLLCRLLFAIGLLTSCKTRLLFLTNFLDRLQ